MHKKIIAILARNVYLSGATPKLCGLLISLFASQRPVYQETSEIEIYNLVGLLHVLFNGSYRLEQFLKIGGFLKTDFAVIKWLKSQSEAC